MVRYAAEGDRRVVVFAFVLFIVAVVLFGFTSFVKGLLYDSDPFLDFLSYTISASPVGLCALTLTRSPFVWLSKITNTPFVGGQYEGILTSNHDGFKTEYEVILEIKQRFFDIEVNLKTSQSRSYVTSASLSKRGGDNCLTYTYKNDGSVRDELHEHQGTCTLVFHSETVEGEYYTNPSRRTAGRIELKKIRNQKNRKQSEFVDNSD